MGYTLKIGELDTSITDDGLESIVLNDVKHEVRDDAPAFGEPTDKTNSRWPSYTQWSNAMKFIGLHEFMFNKETGLIRNHPGCVPLKKEHKEIVDDAYERFYQKYPNAKAGFSPKINERGGVYEDEGWPEENDYAVRLEWLNIGLIGL